MKTIIRRIKSTPWVVIASMLAVVNLILTTVNIGAYSGGSGWKSMSSGTKSWFTLSGGRVDTFTLDFLIPSNPAVLVNIPIVYGVCGIIILLMGITYAVTRNIRGVIITAIAGFIILLGVMILESAIISYFGG